MKKKKYIILIDILLLLLLLTSYYLIYPSININNPEFWTYLIIFLSLFIVINLSYYYGKRLPNLFNKTVIKTNNAYKIIFIIPVLIIGILLVNLICSPLFNAKGYYNRIKVDETHSFTDDIKEADFNKIPLLDKDSSSKLGDRTMGSMSDLVSQFDVSDIYTQINYNDEIVRVTPLEYNGTIKWFTNRENGVPGYIIVNSTTGKSKLVRLKKGMKYMPSALFNENLYRKLQLTYPTYNFGDIDFEIDNEGNPYWIASVIDYTGVGLKREVSGVVILDPITGKSKYYKVKDVPKWVDHVYDADIILEQVNDWGSYKNGYINSVISQKGVVMTTSGYNYLAQDDDIYLYTGITSVISDESNIGFILTNMRTKETRFYSVSGAEEYSAMDSAKGQVQQMKYTSTFPLLINLNNRPTYLVSLKDNAGLVKMYGFVDVVDYQKVVVTDSSKGIKYAKDSYLNEIGEDDNSNSTTKEITIKEINTSIIDGNTYYYIIDTDDQKYKASIKVNKNKLPFIKVDDKIKITYNEESKVINIKKIED